MRGCRFEFARHLKIFETLLNAAMSSQYRLSHHVDILLTETDVSFIKLIIKAHVSIVVGILDHVTSVQKSSAYLLIFSSIIFALEPSVNLGNKSAVIL